ncbi:MAG: hypothetical protein IKD78_10865 [Bacteroidales bacterium]|jgi:hypothetical protein|nr:hypothetical protein [Bacteroidales bacterium]MBR6928698.1 hypothetical protein [Bacteroidales bacterium]
MTTVQLTSALQREMSYIVTDETMMERALKSLRKIRRERKAEKEIQNESEFDTPETVEENLRQSFRELKLVQEGKLETRSLEEVLNEL